MERLEYERMAALEGTLWWYRGLHASLLERLARIPMPELPYVLDAGCGTGGFLSALRTANSRIVPIGVEFDAIAARMAAAKSGAIMVNGSVNALPFGENRFGAIVSADVLCQSGVDEALALRESHRCLKSGGHLLINLPPFP